MTKSRSREAVPANPRPALELRAVWEAHTGTVVRLAVSADATRALSVGFDRSLRLWSVADGTTTQQWETIGNGLSGDLSPDGARVVALDSDGRLQYFEVGETKPRLAVERTNLGFAWGDRKKLWLLGNQHAVFATVGSAVAVWDLATGSARWTSDPVGQVTALGISSAATFGAAVDKSVTIWELATGRVVRTIKAPSGFARAVAFSPDDSQVLVAISGGRQMDVVRIHAWNLATGKRAFETKPADNPKDKLTAMCFAPDCTRLVTSALADDVRVYDVASGLVTARAEVRYNYGEQTIAISNDGRLALISACTAQDDITLWQI